jgi:IclR family mhp operon transcriptional activator
MADCDARTRRCCFAGNGAKELAELRQIPYYGTLKRGISGMAANNPVAPVVRALQLLAALNHKPASSLAELHAATGLPKPTLIRLLGTLIAVGYATRISSHTGYRITERVLALSSGLRFIDRIVDAAVPPMSQFTQDHAWPIGLAKARDGVVSLLHSTAPQSPLLFDRVEYNMTYRLMYTAIGQAYLAFCGSEERRRLISGLLPDPELGQLGLRDARSVEAHLAGVRRRGYAVTLASRPLKMLGLAIPVRHGRQVLACLVMRFPRSVLTPEQAAERYLEPLNATARAIVKTLEAQDRAVT